jgi:phospholipase C|eukprot:g13176.t1
MLENRAFDHMCGFFPNVNGLKGNETNPLNTSQPTKQKVTVQKTSPYIGPIDPVHSTPATTSKIYGQACLKQNPPCNKPTMDGFIEYSLKNGNSLHDASTLMNAFTPERLPILSTLAEEFAIFDKFHASVPGPTWPNRLFQLMGTSKGCTETNQRNPHTFLYFGKTIFDLVEEAGHDWRFYYKDAPLEMALIAKLTFHPFKVKGWRKFKKDVAEGTLPSFSWVNPQWFVNKTSGEGSSDQHPDHDVRLGEALLKEVYETLRAGKNWEKTALIITYDEHGGYYDHVSPPENIPAPDDIKSYPDDFDFQRLGIRVPTLLISPWIQKGTVISEPHEHEKPQSNSEFDLTSIISSVKNIFNAPNHLTKRDAWAATFDTRLNLTSPRTDCPMKLPEAPTSLGKEHAENEAKLELNDLQKQIVTNFHLLHQKFSAMKELNMNNGNAIINTLRDPAEKDDVEQKLMKELFQNYDIEMERKNDISLPKFQGDAGEWIQSIMKHHYQYFNLELDE